jgi:ATP-dependent DNA ligase
LERRERLQILLDDAPPAIQFSEAVDGGGKAFVAAADAMGLEGIVSKRAKAAYISGRSRAWLKIKSYVVSELEVAAVLEGRGKPTMALMVDRENNYLGGAFITNRHIKERLLSRDRSKAGPLPKGMEAKPDAKWLQPGVMASIRHLRGEETCGMPAWKTLWGGASAGSCTQLPRKLDRREHQSDVASTGRRCLHDAAPIPHRCRGGRP